MISVLVLYGFVGAFVIEKNSASKAVNASLAAGLINGLTAACSAIGLGFFGSSGIRHGAGQPQLFVCFVLILIYIEAFALYGLIEAIELVAKAKGGIDINAEAVVSFLSVTVLANVGGVAGSVLSGIAIMEVGSEQPGLVMKIMPPVIFNGVTGIYGLLSASVDTVPWPAKGNDSVVGVFYLVSSFALANVGYHGVKAVGAGGSLVTMNIKLVFGQSIGLLGLIIGLFKHGRAGTDVPDLTAQPYNLMSTDVTLHEPFPAISVLVSFVFLLLVVGTCFHNSRQQRTLQSPLLG